MKITDIETVVITSPDKDRQEKISQMLNEKGITNHRLIEGVFCDSFDEIETLLKQYGEHWRMVWHRIENKWGIGTWGCLLAHAKIWSMVDSGEISMPCVVLEDDVEFNAEFIDFDLTLFEEYDFTTLHTKKTYGTYAYLLRESGARKLLENLPPKLAATPDGTIDLRIVRRKVKGLKVHRPGIKMFKHVGVPNDIESSIRLQMDAASGVPYE